MNVWTRVRSLWESDEALESAADSLLFSLNKMCSKYPERDLNAWLAWALKQRSGWAHRTIAELLSMAAPYSILSTEQATKLLGLDVVVEEYPELKRIAAEKHQELYLPIDFAIKNGSFLKCWKETNPWTHVNYPAIARELQHGFLAGQSSKAVEKVRITCPHCRVELRVPSFTGGKKIRCPGCKAVFSVEL
jgi:hypothetical protein